MDMHETIKEVKQVARDSERMLRSAPSGILYIKYNDGVRYFSREKGNTTGKYLGKGTEETVKSLEEKAYYTELLKVAKQEELALKKIQKILQTMPDYKSVFLNIPLEKRHLIQPYEYIPQKTDELVRIFNKKPVAKDIKLVTQNGEHVRSKSELIIADRLKAAGIPYFYEDPLILAEEKQGECLYWHPDFRVQNIKTGKLYYWEHFGLLDNQEYCVSCQEKLEIYAHYGYFPGENLIITTESSNHGLNMEYVDCLISRYLIGTDLNNTRSQ